MSKLIYTILFSAFLFIFVGGDSFSQSDVDKLIDYLQKTDTNNQKVVFNKIITAISDIDHAQSKQYVEKLLKITSEFEDKYLYNQTRIFYTRFGPLDENKNILNSIIKLSEENNDLELMINALQRLIELYQQDLRYDSVVIATIKLRNLYQKMNKQNEIVIIIHQLGDLYFHAGLLDKAENFYKEVIRLKGDPIAWFNWRKFVITNNFGLIERERKNYDKAIEYHKKALNELLIDKKYIMNVSDSIRMLHSYTTISNLYFLKGDYNNAWEYIQKTFAFEPKYKVRETLPQIYSNLGMLYFKRGEYDSSFYYLNKAKSFIEVPISYRLEIAINKYLADIYFKKKDYQNAYLLLNKNLALTDSLVKREKTFEALELVSDDYIAQSEEKVEFYKWRQNILIAIILIISLSVILILLLFIRLQKAHRKLIKKTLEQIKTENTLLNQESTSSEESTPVDKVSLKTEDITPNELMSKQSDESEKKKLKELVNRLEDLMNERQLYLDPSINLDYVAQILETNRTILSKAVNLVLEMNFSTYINNLRIKKALIILTENYETSTYNFEGIAKKVGFANRTSFIAAFKNYTGVTPSFFIKNLSSNQQEE